MDGTSVRARPLARSFDALLFDLDGVCIQGSDEIPHAADALAELRRHDHQILFVTNNASRTHAQVVERLAAARIAACEAEVVTSSDAIASLMAAELPAGARVLVIGADGLVAAVKDAGLTPVFSAADSPLAVVQGYGPLIGWRDLAEAAYAIGDGARYFASNLDLTLPTERGFAPGNGSLVAAVTSATGVRPVAAGKPEPGIFLAAAASVSAQRPLMVGDRLDTDIRGANLAGMATALVLTGVNGVLDAALAAPPDRPTHLLADLRGLNEPYRFARAEGDIVALGAARARWDGEQLIVAGGSEIERARCVCAAAWARADAGMSVVAANLAGWSQT